MWKILAPKYGSYIYVILADIVLKNWRLVADEPVESKK